MQTKAIASAEQARSRNPRLSARPCNWLSLHTGGDDTACTRIGAHRGELLGRECRIRDLATTSNIRPSEEMTTMTRASAVISSLGT